jgi:hypothetical protein
MLSHGGKKEEYSCGDPRWDPLWMHPARSSELVLFERKIPGGKGAAQFHLSDTHLSFNKIFQLIIRSGFAIIPENLCKPGSGFPGPDGMFHEYF